MNLLQLERNRSQSLVQSFGRWTRSFHQSSTRNESTRERRARAVKVKNLAKRQAERARLTSDRPHPVLGLMDNQAGDQAWKTSKLYSVLVRQDQLHPELSGPEGAKESMAQRGTRQAAATPNSLEKVKVPEYLAFGLKPSTADHLLHTLPDLTLRDEIEDKSKMDRNWDMQMSPTATAVDVTRAIRHIVPSSAAYGISENQAAASASAISRIIDLRNANARGVAFENRRRCIEAFADPKNVVNQKGPDTGRPEVQAALLTAKIRNLWDHLKAHSKDIHNRRSLRMLVHQRAKILKYLRRKDPLRYEAVLPQLGLEKSAVEGEIVVR
ncbi:hypothetical protein FRC03_007368 [Tulasnella sp. 419]|nr:hypothetical protein FRC03_007368 [Tulasnella sp. 419]